MLKTIGIVKALALTGGIAFAAAGCASVGSGPEACTLIGCESGLTVDVRGDRGGDVSVKVVAADGQLRSFECDAGAMSCSAFFADYMPGNVTVTVTKKEGNVVRSYGVTYRNTTPNGEDCPPVCRQGNIDMVI